MTRKINAIQFNYDDDIMDLEYDDETCLSFFCSMVSTCAPLFDGLYDNYDVADCLEKAGVLNEECDEDSESCGFGVTFDSKEKAERFLERLNGFLVERANKLNEVKKMGIL